MTEFYLEFHFFVKIMFKISRKIVEKYEFFWLLLPYARIT